MRRILRQQVYTSRLPQRIRFRTGIGHKTGDWPPLLGNDVGIMYPPAPAGPIVIAVFTNGNTGSFFDLEADGGPRRRRRAHRVVAIAPRRSDRAKEQQPVDRDSFVSLDDESGSFNQMSFP